MGVQEWEGGGCGYEEATVGGVLVVTQTVCILNASVSISCFDIKLQFCKILVAIAGNQVNGTQGFSIIV